MPRELRHSPLQLQVRVVFHSESRTVTRQLTIFFVSHRKSFSNFEKKKTSSEASSCPIAPGIFINAARMWLPVGIAILLSGMAIASPSDENAYYLAETNEERSMDVIEKSRYELDGAAEGTIRSAYEDEQPAENNGSSDETEIGKIDEKRTILKMNTHDRSSTHLQAPAPLSTLLYWPNGEEQIVSMEQRRNPVIEERRNPSFSPWGGKRGVQRFSTITKIRRPVRVPFNSWGGKRNGQKIQRTIADLKRGKFLKWGGKKAPPFNSWGGKRGENVDFHLVPLNHRQALRERQRIDNAEARKDFQSDTAGEESYAEKSMSNETWGKRGSLKPSVGGDITTSGSTMGDSFQRVPFEPWGGKKRAELRFHDDSPPSAGVSLIFRKIGRFIPWSA